MKTLRNIMLMVALLNFGKLVAQDYHLSMTDDAAMLLNPALSGMFDGSYRAHLQHRSQWKSIVNKPFTTEFVSVEKNFKQYGAGIFLLNNRAGVGNFNMLNIYLAGSYEITLDPAKFHHLLCGVQLGMVQNSVNISNLSFDNQYSMSNGGGFDPNLPSGENFGKTSALAADVNFGVYYTMQKKRNFFSSYVYKTTNFAPYGGMTLFHLTQPKLTFSDYRNKINMRFLMYGGVKYKINSYLCVDPSITWQNQSKMNDFTWGASGYYYISQYRTYAALGMYHRVKDAIVLSIGGVREQYALKFSYDINVSKLKALSHGRGGFELSLTYTMLDEGSYPMF